MSHQIAQQRYISEKLRACLPALLCSVALAQSIAGALNQGAQAASPEAWPYYTESTLSHDRSETALPMTGGGDVAGDYFPLWIRLTHFFNFLFITLLIRSGIEIIGAHPKFYWNDDCLPGSEWLRLTKGQMPETGLWTAEDEITPLSSWVALPGRNNLGLGRHWHFWSGAGWLVVGAVYIVCLFATSHWRRLVPTSWEIIPNAWSALTVYLQFQIPPDGDPFNPLQQHTSA